MYIYCIVLAFPPAAPEFFSTGSGRGQLQPWLSDGLFLSSLSLESHSRARRMSAGGTARLQRFTQQALHSRARAGVQGAQTQTCSVSAAGLTMGGTFARVRCKIKQDHWHTLSIA